MKKPALAIVLVGLFVVLLLLFWQQQVNLDNLGAHLSGLIAVKESHPLMVSALFFAAYVAMTALSLPVAAWMTLAAGALFGFWQGLLLASFASALGATLAFLIARYLARDWVRARLGARLERIEAGLARDGPFYLFSLRLIPVVPFFAINLLMGLTPIRVWTFYWVSQLGMLAGAAVYVNAGTQLSQIDSLRGIVSAPVLASFAALGVFPWIARAVLTAMRRRRVYADWSRPKRFDRNLVVIGAGSAGLVSAYLAAATKARITLVEAGKMGGDCLNHGCVPSKALIRSAQHAHQMRHASRWGLTDTPPAVPFDQVMARVRRVIAEIAPHDSVERYTRLGVDVRQGHARLIDPWTVEITDPAGETRRLTTRAVIIATGARPIMPKLPGLNQLDPLTSDTLWDRLRDRNHAPRRLVILGGGPIGCELAQAFARLGSEVTLIEAAPRLMTREDPEISSLVQASMQADGVTVLTAHQATEFGIDGDKWVAVARDGTIRRIVFDEVILAVGRRPRLTGLGLEDLGIPTGDDFKVNDYLETRFPNILAAGDVAGPYQFTHTASHQAWFASVNALFGALKRAKADYRAVPRAIFTDPEVARVGLSEAEATERSIAYEVTHYDLADLDRATIEGARQGFVKVLTVPRKDRILGVTIVGEHAGDLIAEFVLAMRHGLGRILGTIHIYPTWSEAAKNTAGVWRRAHINPRLLALAKWYHDRRRR